MKFLDEKGRLFGKINLFDLIAAAVLIGGLLLIAILPKLQGNGLLSGEDESAVAHDYHHATYQFEIADLSDYMVDSLAEGDVLYKDEVEIGVIKSIHIEKQKVDALQEDGSYQVVERPLHYNVELVVETNRFYEDEGRFINGKSMLNGTTHTLTNGILNFDAVVRQVEIGAPLTEEEMKEVQAEDRLAETEQPKDQEEQEKSENKEIKQEGETNE